MLKQIIEETVKEVLMGETKENGQGSFDNGMIGEYVIVRCRDAGVHSGFLVSHNGRECILRDSRRIWYWKVRGSGDFLSAISLSGVHEDSKLGATVEKIHLTENCEIIKCSDEARESIIAQKVHNE